MDKQMRAGEGSVEAVDIPTAPTAGGASHSRLPWTCGDDTENVGGGMNIHAASDYRCAHTSAVRAGGRDCISDAEAKANARYIVTACNAYPALVEALKDLAELAEGEWAWMREPDGKPCPELCGSGQCHTYGCIPMKLNAARAALAQAEGK